MFGLAWTEIALIGVVAMVLIGPKDLPLAVKAVADVVKKARRMAGEFQVHVDDMMRDSNLREVRDSIAEIRRMDITGDIRRAVDSDGSLHRALNENPFEPSPSINAASITGNDWMPHTAAGTVDIHAAGAAASAGAMEAPAFIPPSEVPGPAEAAPAFIPPEAARPSA